MSAAVSPVSVVDAHQHFWSIARTDYGWLDPSDPVLYRDFLPDAFAPFLERAGIAQTVLVQAAPTVDETRFLLGLAHATPFVGGVVGWVDLENEALAETLDELAAHAAFRGVRPMIQDLADDDWMLRETVGRGLSLLAARGLRFDALVLPRHLGRLATLCARHPELPVVVDHGAKPPIESGALDDWKRDIERIARESPARCKLSGLATEAGAGWDAERLRPVVDHLLACFGAERLLWGSDWPVLELAGGFDPWWEATEMLLAGCTASERAAILGGNARAFYDLPPPPPKEPR